MKGLTVFTNNGMVIEYLEQKDRGPAIKWITATVTEVLEAARAAVGKGSVLLSSPPSSRFSSSFVIPFGNKPDRGGVSAENPYLSLLVGPPGQAMDFESARKIEEALKLHKRDGALRFLAYSDEEIFKFQTEDLETFLATLLYAGHLGL